MKILQHWGHWGDLGVASANQVATLCVNGNVSSCLKGEHIGDRGIGGIGGIGDWWIGVVCANAPCVNENVSLHLKGEHIGGIGSTGKMGWQVAHANQVGTQCILEYVLKYIEFYFIL